MPNTYTVNCGCCGGGSVSTGCACDPMPRRIFLVITFDGIGLTDCPGLTFTGHVDYVGSGSTWAGSVTDGGSQTIDVALDCGGPTYRFCFGGLSGGGLCLGATITCGGNVYTFPNSFYADGIAHACTPLDVTYSDTSDPTGGHTLIAVISATS